MDPIATLSIVFAAFFLVFLHEFKDFFIKMSKIRGVKLWLPLLWMSWLIQSYYDFIHFSFLWFQASLSHFFTYLSSAWSSPYSRPLIQITFLFILGILPLTGLYWRAHFKLGHQFIRRKIKKKHPIAHRVYIMLWIIISILVVTTT